MVSSRRKTSETALQNSSEDTSTSAEGFSLFFTGGEEYRDNSDESFDLFDFAGVEEFTPAPYLNEVNQENYPGASTSTARLSVVNQEYLSDNCNGLYGGGSFDDQEQYLSDHCKYEFGPYLNKVNQENYPGASTSTARLSVVNQEYLCDNCNGVYGFGSFDDRDQYLSEHCKYVFGSFDDQDWSDYLFGSQDEDKIEQLKAITDYTVKECELQAVRDEPLYQIFETRSNQEGGGGSVEDDCEYVRDYTLTKVRQRESKKFGAINSDYELKIAPPSNRQVPMNYKKEKKNLYDRIKAIITDIKRTVEPHDWIGLYLMNPYLKREKDPDIWVTERRADQLDANSIMAAYTKVSQSYGNILFQGVFTLKVVQIHAPEGGRGKKNPLIGNVLSDFLRLKTRSVLVVNNLDRMCLARAVVLGKAYADQDFKFLRRLQTAESTQREAAKELLFKVGLQEKQCTLEDVEKIASYLSEYRFLVYSTLLTNFVHKGPVKKEKNIILLYDAEKKHYHALRTLPGFFGTNFFCIDCNVKYGNKNDHKCTRGCKICGVGEGDCVKVVDGITCSDCNRFIFSNVCFKNHKARGVCKRLFRCEQCNVLVDTMKRCKGEYGFKTHRCGEIYCKRCKAHFPKNHLCYMSVPSEAGSNKRKINTTEDEETDSENANKNQCKDKKIMYIFYYFEATQESLTEGKINEFEHQVNFVVSKQQCGDCIDNDELKQCESCGTRKNVFHGESALQEFVNFVFTLNSRNLFEITAIAHNSSGYDAQFILTHSFKQCEKPEIILATGTKITYMKLKNVGFIDSCRFLPMALAKIPEAFELEDSKKGDFPHFFNTAKNWSYEGPLPDFEYYGAGSKSEEDSVKLYSWWKEQRERGYNFNFQAEIREYCENDVAILEKGCLKFREAFIQDGIDPFRDATTIASACNLLFRKKFLKPFTIGLMNPHGYNYRDTQSHKALTWLKWEEEQRKIRIQHAGNGRETVLANKYKVDGFYPEEKLVFEFQGCAFHGCPKCYSSEISRKKLTPGSNNRTMVQAYDDTTCKVKLLQKLGYTVIEKWECDFYRDKINNKVLEEFCKKQDLYKPLNPRDAFFGGRTNATTLYYKKEPGEIISYVDVCSLYPFINKYGKYPIAHPQILTANLTTDITQYEGLIKCKVLPPDRLYHPVLPVRLNKKLIFPLCITCAETQPKEGRCTHSDKEWSFDGTWVSEELKKAVSMGYKVLQVYEVWQFHAVLQYFNGSKDDGLFNAYIDHFLKMKLEASGFPRGTKTEGQKDAYIIKMLNREGICLDKENIKKNPGRRQQAKLCLNSFWGKFGQRDNLAQLEYVTSAHQLNAILHDQTKEINSVCFPHEEVAQVQWNHVEEFIEPGSVANPFIAAYTTAQARLKLYSYLEKLGERVLYFDTDSVIYVTKPGQELLPTGSFLGELTDELEEYGSGASIHEFVSGGPKNYAYTVVNSAGGCVGSTC